MKQHRLMAMTPVPSPAPVLAPALGLALGTVHVLLFSIVYHNFGSWLKRCFVLVADFKTKMRTGR